MVWPNELQHVGLWISRNVPSVVSPVEDHLSGFGVDVSDIIGATRHWIASSMLPQQVAPARINWSLALEHCKANHHTSRWCDLCSCQAKGLFFTGPSHARREERDPAVAGAQSELDLLPLNEIVISACDGLAIHTNLVWNCQWQIRGDEWLQAPKLSRDISRTAARGESHGLTRAGPTVGECHTSFIPCIRRWACEIAFSSKEDAQTMLKLLHAR
mmetsp:Transcript_62364/g.126748  ORF Transcript_62364/g.126748 Transcript_62364/m.126748 type:complete len:215 (+) Transcript_62364:2904-3548(+)